LKKYNAIIIGLGKIGMQYGFDSKRKQPASHTATIIDNPNLTLKAVCDVNEKTRYLFTEKYGNDIPVYEDYSKLFKEIQSEELICDIIVIATPDFTHEKLLESLLENLKNVKKPTVIFCEKPLTENLTSAKKIQQMMNNSNVKIIVNHTRRWSNIWKEAYSLSKDIGEIQEAVFYFSTSPENKEVEQIRDGIHIADILSWFNITSQTKINRLNTKYFIYDFYLWGNLGKIEIINFGETLNFYKPKKSSRFENFNELELILTKTIEESTLVNAYDEIVTFLNNDIEHLTNEINDAIMAHDVFEKYVYKKKFKNSLEKSS